MTHPPPPETCPLCRRPIVHRSVHHLVPRSRVRGGPTVAICRDCHSAIHAFFDNRELQRRLDTVEALLAEPRLRAAIDHIARQPPSRRTRTARPLDRRRRRR